MVAETLEKISQICRKRNQSMPSKLVLISDNTVREVKNSHCMSYLAHLVARRKMRLCAMLMLRKSHTHCRLDQVFGVLARRIANTDRILNADDTCDVLNQEIRRPGFRAWIGSTCEANASKLDGCLNWRDHFTPQGVSLSGRLLVDATSNHSFVFLQHKGSGFKLKVLFFLGLVWFFGDQQSRFEINGGLNALAFGRVITMHPWDLPEQLQNAVDYGSWRGDINPGNVVCLAKRYIADGGLTQQPLLVLPSSRVQCVPSMFPTVKYPACIFSIIAVPVNSSPSNFSYALDLRPWHPNLAMQAW